MRANKLQDDSRSNRQHFRILQLAGLALLLAACARDDGGLRVTGDRLFVPVTINGVGTEALLDSGAEMTLVDAAFAARLALGAAGSATARGTGGEQQVSSPRASTFGRPASGSTTGVLRSWISPTFLSGSSANPFTSSLGASCSMPDGFISTSKPASSGRFDGNGVGG